MRSFWLRVSLTGGVALLCLAPAPARGEEIPKEYRGAVKKGLDWLQKHQNADGSWSGVGGQYAVTMTALVGQTFLMEGSTLREGKYRDNIRKAADWLMARTQSNGLIGNPAVYNEGGRYMYGHGFGMLFLASLVGEEDSERRRRDLIKILEKAARYSYEAQTSRGGWGYLSSKDVNSFDEGSVTVTQLQGLRAARNAGVIVPAEAIKKAVEYLRESTTENGDVIYSLTTRNKAISPALTAAAICCGFSAGEYDSPLVRKWFKYCQTAIGHPGDGRRQGHDEYTHYYFSQAVYVLGEDRWAKMFPDSRPGDRLTWKGWRKALFDHLLSTQSSDGSWSTNNWTAQRVGPVYVTAVYVSVMQLDKATLPIYQR
jgi:squalene cyclase